MKNVFNTVKEAATKERVDVSIGKSIWEDEGSENQASTSKQHVPVLTAMAMCSDCSLGRHTYTKQRKLLTQAGHDILPSWYELREEQRKLSIPVLSLPAPHVGVY